MPGKRSKTMMVTGLQCPRCEEKIWSRHRHDFRHCGCGYCFVDGGRDYLRYGYGVGLPEGRENDGTVTKEEWAAVDAQNVAIGKPKMIKIRVPAPPPPKEQEWPYPGYVTASILLASKVAEEMKQKAAKELKKNQEKVSKVKVKIPTNKSKLRTSKEKSDELQKPRDRVKADSVRPATRGSKRRPSKPIRRGKNKAAVRK